MRPRRRGPQPAARRGRHVALAAFLVIAGALLFANSLDSPFVIDDRTSIETNARIRQLWPLSYPLSPPRETPVAGRPLVNLSLAINYAAGGYDVRGYHLVNLVIHLLATLVLFGVVRRTAERAGMEPWLRGNSREVAFACALIWMIHPLQTEVVNYVTQRTSSLMGLMYLLTLYCGIRSEEARRGRWRAWMVAACAAGMACKESMVTAPLMVVLYDRTFVFASFGEAMRRRGRLYVGLAATWLILAALLVQGPRSTVGFDAGVDAWTYLLNQATIIVDYLRLAVPPWDLVLDYGVPRSLMLSDVLVPALVIVGLVVMTLVALVRWPRVGFLGAWFFVTLAPTSSIVPIATEVGAERRMYLPLAALVVLVVCAVCRVVAGRKTATTAAVCAGVAVCAALAAGTITRNREYDSPLSLARLTSERRPHGRVFLRMGTLLLQNGRRPEALDYFRRARQENAMGSRFALGTEYLADGDIAAGIRELSEFVRRYPEHANVVPARAMLGRAFQIQGRLDEAVEVFTLVLKDAPNHPIAHEAIGDCLIVMGRPAEALAHLQFVVAQRGMDVVALGKLGTALLASGRFEDAAAVFTRAVAADPNHVHARRMLGRAVASQGRLEHALAHFERALELDPSDALTRLDVQEARSQLARRSSPATGRQ